MPRGKSLNALDGASDGPEKKKKRERERPQGEASSPTSLRLVSDRTARSLELIVAPQILQ